ncbi:hypothetical protein [Kocuria aegyptia]|uniref:Uncharacterized protein n=1 Tax=Kocuria aegyptia TaxID=330943 RepID=A0ABN2K4V1_9MICC
MTDTPRPPRPIYPMRYVFPSEITDLATAHGLPTETLIRALNMRWLVDGRGTCWPAGSGSGSGMTLESLLDHGSLVVEWLPPIEEDQRISVIDRHLSDAVDRRRGLPENTIGLLKIPAPVAESCQPRNRASYRIGAVIKVVPDISKLNAAVGETLRTWLTARLAELDLTVDQEKEMTAHQFPMTKESLAAEKDPDPQPRPDDTCADCYHDRDDHDSFDASCAAETSSYYGAMSPCECDAFTETKRTTDA